ncbi:probable aquaporin SIP2-1 [Telopea speciosissima]|uniref:probable aquaporin SIP2-1 n=1 Tax=Telopea speciosissima TaxID=54955 RepID=UPI001CC72F64|nr:probable aquaporin SIP2-1 [Telopea speciosissima]
MASMRLILSDLVLSFMWVWSGALIKLFVYKILGFGFETKGEILKASLSILSMLFFAWLCKISSGGSYNPLTVLSGSVSGNFTEFLFTVGARIPAQVLGSIVGVKYIIETFPEIGHGPRLNVDIHRGALTEGLLTFTIVIISLGLARSNPSSFFIKTWISSVSKLTLHILGSDLTGGCMNPASAMGWAYARGDHITKEHIFVYWLAPIEATLLAIWTFRLLVQSQKVKEEKISKSIKSE